MDRFKTLYFEIDKRLVSVEPLVRSKVLLKIEEDLKQIKTPELSEEQTIKKWLNGYELHQKITVYLKEHGIQTIPPQKNSVLKTFIIASSVVVVSFFVLVAIVFSTMSPILEFNDKGIALLGGTFQISNGVNLDIQTSNNSVKIHKNSGHKQGKLDLSAMSSIELIFDQGHLILTNAPSNEMVWECIRAVNTSTNGEVIDFKLGEDNECHIHLPAKKNYSILIGQGLVNIQNPKYNLDLQLSQGQVQLKPDELVTYKFNLEVVSGVAEAFDSQSENYDHTIKIFVSEGMISHSY